MEKIYQKNCRLCLRVFEYCKSEVVEIQSIRLLYKVCWKYLKSDKNIPLKWNDLWKEGNPLCNDCQQSSQKLVTLNDNFIAVKRDIENLITEFTKEIHKYRSLASSNRAEEIEEDVTRVKEEEDELLENFQGEPYKLTVNEGFVNENIGDQLQSSDFGDTDNEADENGIDWNPAGNMDNFDGLFDDEKISLETESLKPKKENHPNSKYHLRSNSEAVEKSYIEKDIVDQEESSCDSSTEYAPVKKKRKPFLKTKNVKNRRTKRSQKPTVNITCDICNITFGSERAMINHSRKHTFQTWECETCEKTYYNVAISKHKHMRLYHPEKILSEVSLQCDKCDESFDSTFLWEIHCLSHKGEIPFTCQKCSKYFSTFQNYVDHCRYTPCASNGVPNSNEANTCSTCNESFYAKFALWIHELDHTNPDRMAFNCKLCDKTLKTTFLAEKHFISHTEERPYPCDICGRPYGYSYSLELHRKSHKAIEHSEYMCEKCNLIFLNVNTLLLHKRVHKVNLKNSAKATPYPCTLCDQRFSSFNLLRIHQKVHKGAAKCDLCEKSFVGPYDLNKHMSLIHNKGIPQIGIPFKQRKQKLKKASKSKPTPSPVSPSKPRKRKRYVREPQLDKEKDVSEYCCEKCGDMFKSKKDYQNHMRSIKHGKQYWVKYSSYGEKPPYTCVNCNEEFEDRKKIRFHYGTHLACREAFYESKQKLHTFQCKLCDYKARNSYCLTLHERKHTGEKPFQCDNCGLSFSRKSRLNNHIKRTGGSCDNRPYCCKFCPTQCENITQIKEHYNLNPACKVKLDATKRYPCGICGKRIESYKRLLIHMKVHNITSDEVQMPYT